MSESVARKTYVFDKASGQMIEKAAAAPPPSLHFVPDIKAYQVVGPEYGKVISSRSTHRRYLKQHDLVEVGDQKPKWMNQ